MPTNAPQPDLQTEVLNKLNHALDLVIKTAEAASADKDHKVVIQAAREVTRIATLITKLTSPKIKPAPVAAARKPSRPAGPRPAASEGGAADFRREDLILPDLDSFFPAHKATALGLTEDLFRDITRNYQELQAISADMAESLDQTAKGNGKPYSGA